MAPEHADNAETICTPDDLDVALRSATFSNGRTSLALIQTAVFAVSGLTVLYVVNTLWDRAPQDTTRAQV